MTFPIVETADTQSGTVTSNSSSWTLTYPTNIAAGDLLLALVATDGLPTMTATGWNFMRSGAPGSAASLGFSWLKAAGTETGTFSLTLGANEQGAWRIFRITGWFGGTVPTSIGTTDTDSICQIENGTGGTSTNPDPLSANPSNWNIEDTLWIAAIAVDTSRTVSAYPTNLPDLQTADVSGGSNGATLAVAMANSAVASLDPDTFTISASDDWTAMTLAVRPSSAPPAVEYITPFTGGGFFG